MNRYIRALALVFGLSFVAAGVVHAQPQPGPEELIKSTAEVVLTKLKEQQKVLEAEPGRINDLVNQYILPHFDFERMSRWVLGKYWRQATPDQRKRFVGEFRTLLVRTYASSLLGYVDQKIDYLPMRGDPTSGEVTVRSEVQQPGGFPIPVTYDLYKANAEWKVYDVNIDNVSLIANYRTSFAREIRQGGIDGLIEKLVQRNKQAAA